MSTLEDLQKWYLSQCNDLWEHQYGIDIKTLDNPGWSFTVELKTTKLENIPYQPYSYGVDKSKVPSDDDWVICEVQGAKFVGNGGPEKLNEIIKVFLDFARSCT